MSGPEAHPRPSLAASLRLLAIADLAVIRRDRLGEQVLAALRRRGDLDPAPWQGMHRR